MAENGKNVPLNGKTMVVYALLIARGHTSASKKSAHLKEKVIPKSVHFLSSPIKSLH